MGGKPRVPASARPMWDHHYEAVRVVLVNALISARNRGERIVRGDCGYCDDRPRRIPTCCLLCAVVIFREGVPSTVEGNELFVGRKLALPRLWVEDLVHGFDGDECPVTYPLAQRLGRALWRKYGYDARR